MPYTTIVSGTTITASWANANIRDQVVTPFASVSARASAITTPVDGMLSTLTDVDGLDYYNGTAWRVPNVLFVRRTADAPSIASNTALTDDAVLFLDVAPNSVYVLTTQLVYSADPGTDMRVGWSAPAASTLDWNTGSIDAVSSSAAAGSFWGYSNLASAEILGGLTGGAPAVGRPSGLLVTSSTAGPFKFRWAQGTSSGFGTQLKAGSWVRLDRVG